MGDRGRALIIQNDAVSQQLYTEALSAEGFCVEAACSRDARAKIQANTWDVAFVDLTMPGGDGYEFVCLLAAGKSIGIVVMSKENSLADCLEGYSCGADIYLIKPVAASEIVAAARAVLRRKQGAEKTGMEAGWLLEPSSNRLKAPNGATILLSEREFAFMNRVMETPGQPVARDELQVIVSHSSDVAASRSLDMFVARFRKKLEQELRVHPPIITVRSIGFLFKP